MSTPEPIDPSGDNRAPTVLLRLLAAWAVVCIPLAWGVWQVVVKSLVLFR